MKDFNNFKSTITKEEINKISNQIMDNLNKIQPEPDFFSYQRSFNLSLTMKLLEKYHLWLHS